MKQTLLIFEFYQLGDGVLSLPFLRGAMEQYRVVICCSPSVAKLYALCLPQLEVIRYQPLWRKLEGGIHAESGGLGLLSCIRKLRLLKPDIAVSIWPDPRVHFLMACCGAKQRIGFKSTNQNIWAPEYLPKRRLKITLARNAANCLQAITRHQWLTMELNREKPTQPQWKVWRQMATKLNTKWNTDLPWFQISERASTPEVVEFLANLRQKKKPVFMIHPGARMANRRWPQDRFAEVIHKWFIPNNHAVIIVDDGGGNIPVVQSARCLPYKPKDLGDFLNVLSQVDVFLCNDSFPAHAAAALGKKVYTIFSAQEPEWFAPFKNEQRVIQKDVCEFRPCLDYCLKPSYICLEAVTPDDVIKKLSEDYRAAEI